MSITDSTFELVMRSLERGDEDAATLVYHRFADQLVRLARQHIDNRLTGRIDPESVAMSVLESFFDRFNRGALEFSNWNMVFGLLSIITIRKCLNRNRSLTRQKRWNHSGPLDLDDWRAMAKGPSPEDMAIMSELLELALSELKLDEREVVEDFRAGFPNSEIGVRRGLSTRTVVRILRKFHGILSAMLESD
jgi:RNA polymerase sigma-70 factor (ECF subfamily)